MQSNRLRGTGFFWLRHGWFDERPFPKEKVSRRRGIGPRDTKCGFGKWLDGGFSALVVADADGLVDAADEDLAVADVAGTGGSEDSFDHLIL